MGKGKPGGGKHRKKTKSSADSRRELLYAEDGMVYAYVTKSKGDGRYDILCSDGEERSGVIRGTMRRRVWVRAADVVLASPRDFQDAKADIIHKYDADEVRSLSEHGQLSACLEKALAGGHNASGEDAEEAAAVVFADGDLDLDAV